MPISVQELKQKSSKGSVQSKTSNGRLQLVFSYAEKRHYFSLGLSDSKTNRKLAEMKARTVELDIANKPANVAKRLVTQFASCCDWAVKSGLITRLKQ